MTNLRNSTFAHKLQQAQHNEKTCRSVIHSHRAKHTTYNGAQRENTPIAAAPRFAQIRRDLQHTPVIVSLLNDQKESTIGATIIYIA